VDSDFAMVPKDVGADEASNCADRQVSLTNTLSKEPFMTEDEAKAKAVKETDYCYVLAQAWSGSNKDGICLERIFTKGHGEEIRLAWWQGGKQTMRPADIDAPDWGPLFAKAIAAGVFTEAEQLAMIKSLLK
jgi:hypothetical protein